MSLLHHNTLQHQPHILPQPGLLGRQTRRSHPYQHKQPEQPDTVRHDGQRTRTQHFHHDSRHGNRTCKLHNTNMDSTHSPHTRTITTTTTTTSDRHKHQTSYRLPRRVLGAAFRRTCTRRRPRRKHEKLLRRRRRREGNYTSMDTIPLRRRRRSQRRANTSTTTTCPATDAHTTNPRSPQPRPTAGQRRHHQRHAEDTRRSHAQTHHHRRAELHAPATGQGFCNQLHGVTNNEKRSRSWPHSRPAKRR